MTKAALNGLDPLKDLLGDVLSRLEALEAKVGIKPGSAVPKQPSKANVSAPLLNGKSREKPKRFSIPNANGSLSFFNALLFVSSLIFALSHRELRMI